MAWDKIPLLPLSRAHLLSASVSPYAKRCYSCGTTSWSCWERRLVKCLAQGLRYTASAQSLWDLLVFIIFQEASRTHSMGKIVVQCHSPVLCHPWLQSQRLCPLQHLILVWLNASAPLTTLSSLPPLPDLSGMPFRIPLLWGNFRPSPISAVI